MVEQVESKSVSKPVERDFEALSRRDYRFIFPEFLPDPNPSFRNEIRERLERKDMLNRRDQVEIPEFYVGSILAVTVSDENSPNPNKLARFVGICIARGGTGLRAWMIVRNVVDGQGIEFMYQIYNPTVVRIEVLRLEKRLDEELYYLRDAAQHYSTFSFDMEPEILPEGVPVPINKEIVKLNPRPWLQRWEHMLDFLEGYELTNMFETPGKVMRQERFYSERNLGWQLQTLKYDLMDQYRNTVPVEEQDHIWEEVGDKLEQRDKAMRRVAAKRAFVRPKKKI
jgi:large subunit ribosomal protein L19